ncbi:hypothetical protein JRO89_XS09G0155200 [Xanthoceras sorbifolium]|uniref:Retrotransposon gag domain-containing protein n=1 Tax=Xanthoceras sorbifolium TaxID=99658 RepID=A0ABQ8HLE5_9ROSI|nr:hypothetical protein JRO89_XS09G0155200 [Xanthoceras sorbifolium]
MASENSATSLANQPSTGIISSLKHINNLTAINVAAQLPVKQDKLLSLGIIGSLSDCIIPQVTTLKTSFESWNRLTKYYANSSSSRSMRLIEQLISISRGTQPVANYLATVRSLADQLAMIGELVPNRNLVMHTLNGLDSEFKELSTVVRD